MHVGVSIFQLKLMTERIKGSDEHSKPHMDHVLWYIGLQLK